VGVGECAKTAHKAGDRGEIGIRDWGLGIVPSFDAEREGGHSYVGSEGGRPALVG